MKYEFVNKALWFPAEKILAFGDLHLGHEEAMNKAGIFLPRIQFSEIMRDLKEIFSGIGSQKIKEVIILGDLKHEFGSISQQEWKETLAVLDFLEEKAEKIILIKGNHDKILGPIAEKRGIEIRDFYIKEDVCFIHGHRDFAEIYGKKIKMIIMGHRHPAIILSDKYKKEKYKCFLAGKWKGKKVIILPSFFPLIEGTDIINIDKNNKLFIAESRLKSFEVFVVGDRVYDFGQVKKIGRLD